MNKERKIFFLNKDHLVGGEENDSVKIHCVCMKFVGKYSFKNPNNCFQSYMHIGQIHRTFLQKNVDIGKGY